MFYHLDPVPAASQSSNLNNSLPLPLSTPILNTSTVSPLTLELVTLAAVTLGFAWVALKLWPALAAELKGYLPKTVETTEPMNADWREPVRGGPPRRRRG
jgi:hypothetical protein